jgi:hypothetical protein
MYHRDKIRTLFGEEGVSRIDARHKGGESGQKGTRFEDYFAVYLLVTLLGQSYGSGKFRDSSKTTLHSQAYAFVDDLVVELKKRRVVEHYQLKNASSVSWGSGDGSIKEDFLCQAKLCDEEGLKSRLYLVVSNKSQQKNLDKKRKEKNVECNGVLYFPYATPNELLLTYKPFRRALVRISPFGLSDAESDKLSALATFLVGIWASAPNKISLEELAKQLEGKPMLYMRPMGQPRRFPADVAKILRRIPGFIFRVRKGYLFWNWGQADNGIYPFHTGTKAFQNLTKRIRKSRPKTFEALEEQLR